MGPLSLSSSMVSMVRYIRQGVDWLRLDSQKGNWTHPAAPPPRSSFASQSHLFSKGRHGHHLVFVHTDHCTFFSLSSCPHQCLFFFTIMHFSDLCFFFCNPHISCLAAALYLSVALLSVWDHSFESGLSLKWVNLSRFIWKVRQTILKNTIWFYTALSCGWDVSARFYFPHSFCWCLS